MAAVLILLGAASADPNAYASLTFSGFLLILVQNVLLPGSQVTFANVLKYKGFLKMCY